MRKFLFFLCALLTGVGTVWADGPDVSGKTFTLTCVRGNVIGDGSRLFGSKETEPSEFAIVEWDDEVSGGTFLYDVTNKAFIIHETNAADVDDNNNNCKESSTDFSMIIKGLQWKATNTSGTWHLTDENNFYLNMSGSAVRMNTWRDADDGNRYTVTVVNESFDSSEAITMLETYFDNSYGDLLSELIEEAKDIIGHSGIPGYPTASAMSILQSAIDEANSASEKKSAYKSLREAIATAWTDINYIPQSGKYYTIVNARGAMVYDPSHDEKFDTTNDNAKYLWNKTGDLDTTDPNNLWGFVEKDGKYYMYNAGKKQFATVGKGSYGPTWIFSNTPAYITLDNGMGNEIAAPKVRVCATIATTGESYAMSVSTTYTGPVITYDAENDGGVPMLFTEIGDADAAVVSEIEALLADPTPYRKELQNTIASTEGINFGDELGLYAENDAYNVALAAAQAAVDNEEATIEDLIAANDALKAAILGLQLNIPTEGMFLRLKGKNEKYLTYGNVDDNAGKQYKYTDAEDASTIFYFDGTHLVNLASGQSLGMTSGSATEGWDWENGTKTASNVTFSVGSQGGKFFVRAGKEGVSSAYLRDNGDNDRVRRSESTDASGACDWILTEITTLPISIAEVGYATLWSPVALKVPTGVTAYTGTISEDEETLNLTGLTDGVIPAKTAVVLQGAAGSYDFEVTTGGTSVTSNALQGGLGETVEANSILTLQQPDNTPIGFYTYTETGIAGFKAYLTLEEEEGETSKPIKGIAFGTDTTDGIATVEGAATESSAIYNLAGQRVEKAVKGVYIVNGKKVLVK